MKTFSTKYIFCFIIVLLFSGLVIADQGGPSPAGFAWADSQDVDFDWIEIRTDGTVISTVGDINEFYPVPLPFTFYYYNRPFNTVYVSSNGYLTFNNYSSEVFSVNDDLSLGQSPDSLIAIYWDDLNVQNSFAAIYTKTVGKAPYRQFVVEFYTLEHYLENNDLTFEVILYETTNQIKFQYLALTTETGDGATVGLRYPLNTVPASDSLVYSVNQPALSDSLAILFYPSDNLAANFGVNPDTVSVGTNNQPFTVKIDNLTIASDSLQEMGKADSIRINNPLGNNIIVTGIRVDGHDYFYQKSSEPPPGLGFATWNYSTGTQNLTLLFPRFAIKDSVSIDFVENIPSTPGDFNSATEISAQLNTGGAGP